jgi:hypothetical protein
LLKSLEQVTELLGPHADAAVLDGKVEPVPFFSLLAINGKCDVSVGGEFAGIGPLLSGYKSNRINWIPESHVSIPDPCSERACKMGVFSKIETLKNCRIV